MSERKRLYLSQLRGIQILWPGDIYAFGEIVLRCYDARDVRVNALGRGGVQKSRPTLNGLAGYFAAIADMPEHQIAAEFKKHGLDLGATVEFDLNLPKSSDSEQVDP